jgi:hypothetical protein
MAVSRRGRGVRVGIWRSGVAIAALATVVSIAWMEPAPGRAQASPAGLTGAVLSFIDASAGRLEVARHWPQAVVDVDVFPFVPYFWTGCPGPGAIMILVTAPGSTLDFRNSGRTHSIGLRLEETIRTALRRGLSEPAELWRLVSGARTPGDPIFEATKALIPLIADLSTYERRGYAVFAFVTWQGWRCAVTLRAVPEGYGIPFVR